MESALLILAVALAGWLFIFRQPFFGASPSGDRLERIRRSPQFRKGSFQNLIPTNVQTKEFSVTKLLRSQLNPPPEKVPSRALPAVTTDLYANSKDTIIVWFGHSSYLVSVNSKKILVDPVFSGHAAPVSFFGKSFTGTDVYGPDSFHSLDAILITHDHYDHLDHKSIVQLKNKTKHFYTSLGVGAHLERWGVEPNRITELDWWEHVSMVEGIELIAAPARHFSGRGLKRNNTLWSSFIVRSEGLNLYLGGDSGYGPHFKDIGEKYGPFDLALLECGQYNTMWPFIHMMPEEVVQAAMDLKAKVLMPVHWGKFSLALHPWKEPANRVMNAAEVAKIRITTPRIGEPVIVNQAYPHLRWWLEE